MDHYKRTGYCFSLYFDSNQFSLQAIRNKRDIESIG